MITVIAKSIRNLFLPGILKLLLWCLLAYALGWWVLAWLLSGLLTTYVNATGGEGFIVHTLGSMGGMVLAWFLFPALYPLLISFFDDKITEVIEREDYPSEPKPVPPFWPTIAQDMLFCLKAIGLNIVCLPLYFMPLAGLFIYYGVNGYLLGTQFFRMIAGKRMTPAEAAVAEKRVRYSILLIGIAISVCATIPFLNLLAPVLGVAAMVHLFYIVRTILP